MLPVPFIYKPTDIVGNMFLAVDKINMYQIPIGHSKKKCDTERKKQTKKQKNPLAKSL